MAFTPNELYEAFREHSVMWEGGNEKLWLDNLTLFVY